jgi:hypothetical protein
MAVLIDGLVGIEAVRRSRETHQRNHKQGVLQEGSSAKTA